MKERQKIVFYLKVNRDNTYVISNLRHWLCATTYRENAFSYILCDNENLKKRILDEIDIDKTKVFFINSIRDNEEINKILSDVCGVDKWIKVGQAHLTTHWHADKIGCDYFWNIDADDTFVCLDSIRIAEMLQTVEDYSLQNHLHLNGLDMWRSMSINEHWSKGPNWSLGITFVDNRFNWKSELIRHSHELRDQGRLYDWDKDANLDWYFTYLKEINSAKIETFYVENMKFMHFMDYFFNYPHLSSFMHWKNGKLKFPIWEHCFGTHYRKEIPIATDILSFDIGITDDEGLFSLISCSSENFAFYRDIRNPSIKLDQVMKVRCNCYMEKVNSKELICWGAGNMFFRNYDLIKKAYDLKYVCDSDPNKWGKKLNDNVTCISPNDLMSKKDLFVLIMVENVAANYKIIHQLLNMGIKRFDHFDNWIEMVEGIS